MNLKILLLRRVYLTILILCTTTAFSQSQCFEIQSILVDACNDSAEGFNEMVRFKVGDTPLNTTDLNVSWPNTNITWKGVVQNATTALITDQLNTLIIADQGCGKLIEPAGGILPANATVILVTSYFMTPLANTFGPLSEDIYIIFQNNDTVQTGHFANYSTGTPNNRTLSMNFGTGCLDSVVYDKSLLIKQNGLPGAEDGATVEYTPAGVATYTNYGCQAPIPPFTVDAGPATLTACEGSTITLNGTAAGQQSVSWSALAGSFSSTTTLTTDYTIPAGSAGSIIPITLTATNNCGLQITDVINLTVTANVTTDFPTSLTLCSADTAPVLELTSPNGITGTWSPATISTATSGNYTFTPNAGQCGTIVTLVVTITPATVPDFATSLTLCSTDTAPALATTSPNGIMGTWNPATISTTASGSYTFTPNTGQCATTATLVVTITPPVTPDFDTVLTLCIGTTVPILATTSPNGIMGTWSPAAIDNTTNGNYTFTPNAGECATTTTLVVTITPVITPDFATSLALCSTDTAPTLATSSPNGITGTWSPASIDNTTSDNYTFTPNVGECATTATLAVTITPAIVPDFDTALTLCSTDTAPALQPTSPNGITGTWNPTTISTTTSDSYTFTPSTGQCATTATLVVTITPAIVPDFATSLTLCITDTAPALAATSPNGITGTWNPAIISTTASGSYTFTPSAGQCATTATLAVTITPETIPDFATSLTLCNTDTAPNLATTSPNGITGTWNPATINTTASGNYTFTPNVGQCATTATLAVTITPETIPDFATSLTLCNTDTAPNLEPTSPNGITGTWSPATISTTASGSYTFTPNTGQCATMTTLAVTITPATIPDFAASLTLCSTDMAPTLDTTSLNGITGTWNPATISTTASGSYIFTPDVGQCATTATLAVTITPATIPDFATTLTLCSSDTAPALATTSPNGITGTWNPATISTTTNGTYTFTPNLGQCATTTTLAITVTPETTPDFTTSLTLCNGATAPALATTSPNGITGTWNPATTSSTADATYTFTPNAGQCATSTTLTVTITPAIKPDFATTLTLCSTATAPALATTSPNGITGTWNPATISSTTNGTYTFTPNLGQCATTTTLAVTITPAIKPDFATTLTLCNNDTAPVLATTSTNGITGTWNPATINTTANAIYTFTPNTGQCATATTLAVTITTFAYSTTQECINNEYIITVLPSSIVSSQDLTYTWIDHNGNQVGGNNSTFNFTSYIEKSLDKPILPLQFKVIVGNGSCATEETFTIKNNLCGLPNIITPNGDGINDSFDLTSFNISKVLIFNRWGAEVFNFAGKYEDQWKGQWKEGTKLPTGTYFYIISNDSGDERASWVFLSY